MYPLDRGDWGPTVRIRHLAAELASRAQLEVISGYRGARRLELARFAFSRRLRRLDGVYVESSTFLPSESDIAFLALARGMSIPVLTYVRDAYQLFPEYDRDGSWRRRLGRAAFRPAMRALGSVSSRLAFPSEGLARVVTNRHDVVILPPGSREPLDVEERPDSRHLLFVGNGTLEAQGAPRLITAVDRARQAGHDVGLIVVCRPGEAPRGPHPPWLEVVHGEIAEIRARLPQVFATVIPRPRNSYNDLAVPVKLYDYLAYGRPLLVTDCIEQARVVREAEAGLVVGDSVAALADGIGRMATADTAVRGRWGANAAVAARANSWGSRADAVLSSLGLRP